MESINTLAEQIKETQEFCKAVQDHLDENFIIEGKTMKAWKAYFQIKIPEELNFPIIIHIVKEIWDKFQYAAFFRDSQQVQLAIMEQTKSDRFHTAWENIRSSTQVKTGKPLGVDSCKIHATIAVKEIDAAIANQKVIHTFWVKTCDTLTELRKLLELAGRCLSGDAYANKDITIRGGN